MGKPVLICPSVPSWRASIQDGKIVFGDFSRLFVRVSKLSIVRKLQAPGYVEYGKALYTGRMRADSKIMDASGGSVPPFTYITLTA
jgi:HK97 family phage major capsid protein